MALDAVEGIRVLEPHLPVAFHALLMIGALHSRPQKFFFIEGLAMTAVAAGRLLRDGAIMMTCLANGPLLAMKIPGQFVFFDIRYQSANNSAVRERDRLVLGHQLFDGNRFRYIRIPVGVGNGCS